MHSMVTKAPKASKPPLSSPRVIAITNQKGGSGKTTTSVNLSAALAEKGRSVLLIDLDPQASATDWFGCKMTERGLMDVLLNQSPLAELVLPTNTPQVSIVGSSSWMYGIDKALAGELGAENILARQIRELPPTWDYILMDCPPNLGLLTVSALTAAQEVLVPVEAHVMALAGLAQLLKTIDLVKERLNPSLILSGILCCRVDSRTRHAVEIVEHVRERFPQICLQTTIRENIRLAEAPSFHQPITTYDVRSTGTVDYRALAKEILIQEKALAYV